MLPEALTNSILHWLSDMDDMEKIAALNSLQRFIHQHSPFRDEPIDCVQWIPADCIRANDYNPDSIGPVEQKILELSLLQDGFTQPIVVTTGKAEELHYHVIDGYQRYLLSQKPTLRKRLLAHIPVTMLRPRQDEIFSLMTASVSRIRHAVKAK
ncbi:ParB N-terminal domain-containing protein [Salmonella enterica]